jgi:uracil-DNA glycosylase family 4
VDEVIRRKHPEAKCEVCPLYKIGRYVPSEGPDRADVAFVGEAPGHQEARGGRPFVGPSGRLLERVMEEYGIERSAVLLSNACLCRPPNNDTPAASAIAACRPRLVHELEERGARTVVALGNSAAQSLLGLSGVTKLRVGPGRPAKHNPDVRVISTLHPAAALRQADLFPSIVADIAKVVTSPPPWTEPRIVIFDEPGTATRALQELAARSDLEEVAVDIEVDIDKDTGFDHPNQYGMLCVGLSYNSDSSIVIGETALKDKGVLDALKLVLTGKRVTAQNGKFDLAGLYPHLGALSLHFDTMLAHYVLDERTGGIHGLEGMAVEYLGSPSWKQELDKYKGPRDGYGVIPREVLYKYNGIDVCNTFRLKGVFTGMLEQAGLRHVHDFLVRASNQLMYLELNGIAIDRAYLDKLTYEYTERLEGIEAQIQEAADIPINPRSPIQIKKWFAENGVEVDSTNEDTLKALVEHPRSSDKIRTFCGILLKYRREHKLYSTYVKGIRKRLYRGRVYPTFLLHGTTTGRLSCRNPNLQNIPRESSIRRLFVPGKEGNVFVHVDYSQAELRVLSWLARDEYFRGIFATGRDLFDELTPVLYPYANKEGMGPSEWKELRIRVKAYVYGLAYGRSEYSIAPEFKIPVEEAKQGMDRFFGVIPEIVTFREQTRTKVLSGEDLVTPRGRHRRFWLITDDNVQAVMNEALAFLPQSTASDMTLDAMVELRPQLRGIGFIRNIIHDALLIETPADKADQVAEMAAHEMREAAERIVGDYVPFVTEATIGPSWGDV